jgi:hypothetical protein
MDDIVWFELGREATTWITLLLSTGVPLSVQHVTDSTHMCTEGNVIKDHSVLDLRSK